MIGFGGLSIPLRLLGSIFFFLSFFPFLFLSFCLFFFFFLLNQGNVLNVVPVLTLHNIEPPAPVLGPFAALA